MPTVGNEKVWVIVENEKTLPKVCVNAFLLLGTESNNVLGNELQNIKEVLYYATFRSRPIKQFSLMIDMHNTKLSNINRKFIIQIANDLKNDRYLDDTMASCTLFNSNATVETLYDMVSFLLDKETKKKIKLVKAPTL